MKSSKKLLSFFLAVVMVFSVLTVMASAYTVGPEVAGNINFKYTVEKATSVPANDEVGSEAYSADNLYGVTIWMQCDDAVSSFTAPIHYNKTKFAPVAAVMEGVTYPGAAQDTWATDMGGMYVYTLGDFMNNTSMYKADGTVTTAKLQAKCIGIGCDPKLLTVTTDIVSPDHSLYSKWGAGLPENTGVMYVNLDVTSVSKAAYLNTITGIEADTGWNRMITFYFEALTDDVTGAEFGVFTEDCFTVDGITDTYAGYYTGTATSVKGNPTKNVVSNAKVEAEKLVYHVKNQIQWADKDANTVNLGVVAGFDIEDIAINFNDFGTSTDVTAVGAKVTINGNDDTKTERFVYAMNDGASYYFRAVIENVSADYEGDIVVTPFVEKGEDTFEGDPVTIDAAELATLVAKLPA